MSSVLGFFKRNYAVSSLLEVLPVLNIWQSFISPPVPSGGGAAPPLKFGILGAAAIAPAALVLPAKSHPEVELYAVAARDITRAERFAKKHGFKKWYGGKDGYQRESDYNVKDLLCIYSSAHDRTSR